MCFLWKIFSKLSIWPSCHILLLSFSEETNNCVNFCWIVLTAYITTYSDVVGQTVMDVSLGKGGNNFENLNKKLSPVVSTCLINRKSLTLPAFHTQEILIFIVLLVSFKRQQSDKHFIYFLLLWFFSLCWPLCCLVHAAPGTETAVGINEKLKFFNLQDYFSQCNFRFSLLCEVIFYVIILKETLTNK